MKKLMIIMAALSLAACGATHEHTITITSSVPQPPTTPAPATTSTVAASDPSGSGNPNSTDGTSPQISCVYNPASQRVKVTVTGYGWTRQAQGDYTILDSYGQSQTDDLTLSGNNGTLTGSTQVAHNANDQTGWQAPVLLVGQGPYRCLLVNIGTVEDNATVSRYLYNDDAADAPGVGAPASLDSNSLTATIAGLS